MVAMPKQSTPIIMRPNDEAGSAQGASVDELNLRIEAFLSLKSQNTQRTYRSVLKEWCSFLSDNFAGSTGDQSALFRAASDIHAAAYKKWLEGRPGQRPRMHRSNANNSTGSQSPSNERRRKSNRDGLQSTLSNATIAKKFAALRRIYRMLIAYDFGITDNPFDTDKIPPPAARAGQKRPTEMVDFSKVKEILELPERSTSKGLRDKALLAILFGGGLRRGEVVKIRLGDVRRSQAGTVYLHLRATKARKDADQALPAWAVEPVLALVEQRIESGAEDGDYLFISYRGKGGQFPTNNPLSANGLYKLFKRYCILAGAGDLVSPHSARATAITKLLSDGVSHREVQEFSRHASVQMVEAYDKRRIGIDENPGKQLDFE